MENLRATNSTLKAKLYQVCRDASTVLLNIPNSKNSQELCNTLQSVRCLLPQNNAELTAEIQVFSQTELTEARKLFQEYHYTKWLNTLQETLCIELIELLPGRELCSYYDVFFLHGYNDKALCSMCRVVSTQRVSFSLNHTVTLLETFLSEHRIVGIMWDQCLNPACLTNDHAQKQFLYEKWDELITFIVSLPERVANKHQQQTSKVFQPELYIKLICDDVMTTLSRVHSYIRMEKCCSVEFISRLIGKLCLNGYGDVYWQCVLPGYEIQMRSDYVWRRIAQQVISHITHRCLESVLLPLLKQARWYNVISQILGQSVLKNSKIEYLLTQKFLLFKHFPSFSILQNIICYIATDEERRELYCKLFTHLLEVWSDYSAVKHTSYPQHMYISAALLVCTACMKDTDSAQWRTKIMQLVMKGVQVHLDCSSLEMRRLGMIVGEVVTARVSPVDEPLKFEYEVDDDVKKLQALIDFPADPKIPDLESQLIASTLSDSGENENTNTRVTNIKHAPTQQSDSELDSDDDLEPYDISHDVKKPKIKAPVYIRDCMEGLIKSDDLDRVEICLKTAERLIRSSNKSVMEVSVEFSQILLHLTDEGAIDNFTNLRFSAMVSLCVVNPKQVAEYLTSQFYAKNYNLRQRMDVLEVLATASRELASPTSVPTPTSTVAITKPKHPGAHTSSSSDGAHWRDIVQQRINSKTRRFAKGRTQPAPEAKPNHFAPVAGDFIFPLLQFFDRPDPQLNLVEDDHIVLVRLLYTLGIIVYSAINAPILRRVAPCLLEVIWTLRYHTQQAVRRALLFTCSMVLLAVPHHMLLPDYQAEVIELKHWLQYVIDEDADDECRTLGMQVAMLLEKTVKNSFQGDSDR